MSLYKLQENLLYFQQGSQKIKVMIKIMAMNLKNFIKILKEFTIVFQEN
jgi:hypothetical protein